jgi:hypothetical protein
LSASSRYNLQYFQQRGFNNIGATAEGGDAITIGATAEGGDAIRQANLPSLQSTSPIQATRLTNTPAILGILVHVFVLTRLFQWNVPNVFLLLKYHA